LLHRPNLARRHAQLHDIAFFGQDLSAGARRTNQLAAATGIQLDVVHDGSQGNAAERQRIPNPNIRLGTGNHPLPNLQTDGSENVALFAIGINQEGDSR
jgi:hypothetical protein